jgi:hypothetical protein
MELSESSCCLELQPRKQLKSEERGRHDLSFPDSFSFSMHNAAKEKKYQSALTELDIPSGLCYDVGNMSVR